MPGSHRNVRTTHRRAPGWIRIVAATLSVAVLAVACGGSGDDVGEQADSIRLLEPTEFAEFVDDNPTVDLINVHIPYQGHIEGTDAFVNFEQILDFAGLPEDRDDPVVLYCRSGNMSGQAAEALAEEGYTNIVDLNGGMNAWTDSGRELLTDEPADG
ncbi:MAG: rhodanese-like domain-containing protein [Acidimicrobiales bacterium]|nr:rhodanese-like domain-containing protein [Acidimicrobiia bacterium]NNF53024.1 rhodanese-like domain-containing protein [Acidimicrobiales bacterium]